MRLRGPLLFGAGVVAGVVAADLLAERRWRSNPDPLDGEPILFPGSDELIVPTDDGAEIRVLRAGVGPTVVLVHGLSASSQDLGPIARRLLDSGHRVIAIDQRGHGGSTVGTSGFGSARLGLDLRQVLDALDLSDVVLAGHSMGGIAAMTYAVDHPDAFEARVSSLGLIATIASLQRSDRQATLAAAAALDFEQLESRPHLRMLLARSQFGTTPSGRLLQAAITSGSRCLPTTRRDASLGLLDYDIRDRIEIISVPTTVVAGTRDLVTPISENRAIAAAIPDATLVEVGGAGHLIIWEYADLVAHELSALVRAPLLR